MKKTELYKLIDINTAESTQSSLEGKSATEGYDIKLSQELIVEDLEDILIEFPYFQTARLLYTIHLQNNNKNLFVEELAKTAVLCADRKRLFYVIQPDNYKEFINLPKTYRTIKIERKNYLTHISKHLAKSLPN